MKKRTWRIAVGTIAALAMLAPLSACGSDSSSDSKGTVYFLNSKAENQKQWEAVAKEYTKETGVKVAVTTAASNTYQQTLQSEMAKNNPPTLFSVDGPIGLQTWKSYAADLSNSIIYKDLNNKSDALKADGKVEAVPYVDESYGLIYNKDLFKKYTEQSYAVVKSVDEINSFDKLKAVADSIQQHKSELGVDGAFTSAGFDSSSNWRFDTHLANYPLYYEFGKLTKEPATVKGTYLSDFKQIFDLYLTDSTTQRSKLSSQTIDDSNSQFAQGKAMFYQNGTWAWSNLQEDGMKADSIGMIPIYMPGKDQSKMGVATGSSSYWCINAKASEADQKATEAFLKWVITSNYGKKALAQDMGFNVPFTTFKDMKTGNPLDEAANAYAEEGKTAVPWDFVFMPSQTWKDNLGSAMLEYAQGTGSWDSVKKAYVDGWATEYKAAQQNS